ncbi:MAG: hypothetical protein K6F32_02405 [Bacilli bacterium]|nr:hypothetical protein [Bacilli bacterium]
MPKPRKPIEIIETATEKDRLSNIYDIAMIAVILASRNRKGNPKRKKQRSPKEGIRGKPPSPPNRGAPRKDCKSRRRNLEFNVTMRPISHA